MEKDAPRVRYEEGQRIRARDLTAEQEYLIALEERHNLAQHGPGIVMGLDSAPAALGTELLIRPGVAVDEQGRALTLEQDAHIESGDNLDVWLIRCDTPLHPCGHRFDRVREHIRAITVHENTLPVPPVDDAIYLGRAGGKTGRTYTFLRASEVRHPAARALMQVGPITGRDRNGFLVSTVNAANKLMPRIAVDRLGTNRFDGTVAVSGFRAWTALVLSETETLFVFAQRPGKAGEQIEMQAHPEEPARLRFEFYDGARKSDAELLLLRSGGHQKAVTDFNPKSDLVTLYLKKDPIRRPQVLGSWFRKIGLQNNDDDDEQQQRPDPFKQEVRRTLQTRGGSIDLDVWEVPESQGGEKERLRGCPVDAVVEDETESPRRVSVSYVALAEAPKAPPLPGMWSVRTGTVAEPGEELRLDLGAKDDNDGTVRLFVGRVRTEATGQSLEAELTVRGNSLVTMPALVVNGDIRVAPIKADYTDPNFTNLLVRAWMDGLAAAIEESTDIKVELTDLPAIIRTDEPWSYNLEITNTSGGRITAGRALETLLVTGTPAPFTNTITLQRDIENGTTLTELVAHNAGELPAGMLRIEIRVNGKRGSNTWRASGKTAQPIPIVAAPTIDVDDMPVSVPRNQPFDIRFAVQNNAYREITLDGVTISENNGAPQAVPSSAAVLAAGESKPFVLPHAGINGQLEIDLHADFHWDASTTTDADQAAVILISDDLAFTFEPHHVVGSDWSYDLVVRNDSDQRVTLTSLNHRIVADDSTVLEDEDFPQSAEIEAQSERTITVPADEITHQTNTIDIEITVGYQRADGQTFEVQDSEEGIDVT